LEDRVVKVIGGGSLASVLGLVVEVAWYLSIVGVILVAGAGLRGLMSDPAEVRLDWPVSIELDRDSYEIASDQLRVEGGRLLEMSGELGLLSGSRGFLLAWLMLGGMWLAAILAVIYQLRALFKTLAAGTPFVRANVWRLRFIGTVIIAVEVFMALLRLLVSLYLRANVTTTGFTVKIDFRFTAEILFVGFVLLVIAEIFRQGTEMREEQALTV